MKNRKTTARFKAMTSANANQRAFHNAVQLERWLRDNEQNEVTFEFTVGADVVTVRFTATNPDDGKQVGVYEGYCMRFNVEPKAAIDNLMKYLNQEKKVDRV